MTEGIVSPPPPPPPPVAPSQPGAAFDFLRPFTFVFDDARWLPKILIGGLMELASIFIVGIFFVMGYNAQLARNVIAGQQHPLPEWDDLGTLFVEGLRLFAVILVYVLPIVLIAGLVFVPLAIFGEMGGKETQDIAGAFAGCAWCLIFPLTLALMVILPAALLMSVVEQRFGAAFEFAAIWSFIKDNLGNYLLAIVVYLVARFASSLGFILFCVGVLFTMFWAMLAATYAFAQTYRLAGVARPEAGGLPRTL